MATYNHKIKVTNGNSTDVFHPETNSGQVYDFTNEKWLNSIIGALNTLSTTQKSSLVEAINEIASKKHIEIVDEIPANLEGKGVFFNRQGSIPSAPDHSNDITAHETSISPHQYGGKFEWRYNETTNSLDLVVLE